MLYIYIYIYMYVMHYLHACAHVYNSEYMYSTDAHFRLTVIIENTDMYSKHICMYIHKYIHTVTYMHAYNHAYM